MRAAGRAAYERLVKMIEHELELAGQGLLEELGDAVTKTGEYMASLPVPAPASAQPVLLRAQALRSRVQIETQRLLEGIELTQASRRRARTISRRYAPQREQASNYSTSA